MKCQAAKAFLRVFPLIYAAATFHLLFLGPIVAGHETGNYYQDLTELIDQSLGKETNSLIQLKLAEALKQSTFVYYSTDLLLNNITQLAPVLNLLNKAKPQDSSQIKLMLSLRYTHQNRFLWQRIDDIFYSLSLDITPDTRRLLGRHLTSVVLDWSVDTCDQVSNSFFSRETNYHGYGFDPVPVVAMDTKIQNISYSFTKYVKSFLQFYCGTANECSKIAVGISYNPVQIGCATYLLNQIRDSDFLLIPLVFSSHSEFPYAYQTFRVYMNSLEGQNERFIGRKLNKRIVYRVHINDPPTVNQLKLTWQQDWNDFENLLSSSSFFNKAAQQMIEMMHEKSVELLRQFIFKYTHYDNMKGNYSFSVILGGSMIERKSDGTEIANISNDLLIPHLFMDEVEATPCSLKWELARTGSKNIIVSAETWRAVARHSHQIMKPNLNCSSYHGYDSHLDNANGGDRNALLVFDGGIIAIWNDVEKYMTQLIKETRSIDSIILKTIIFPEHTIDSSIERFLKSFSKDYSIGCVVNFNKEKLEILKLKTIFSTDVKCKNVMRELCPSIFEQAETFIWNIDDVDTAAGREIIALARQVFMSEFPGKSVLIQVTRGQFYLGNFISDWAEFYRVPVTI